MFAIQIPSVVYFFFIVEFDVSAEGEKRKNLKRFVFMKTKLTVTKLDKQTLLLIQLEFI